MRSWLATFTLAISLSACVAPPPKPAPLAVKFNGYEHQSFFGRGATKVAGQAFLRQKGGGVVTCAGNRVLLLPDTPFFKGLIAHQMSGKALMPEDRVPEEYRSLVRIGQCDAQGKFAFMNLPEAGWLVATQVVWQVGRDKQGGDMLKAVKSTSEQGPDIIVGDSDLVSHY